MAEAIVPANVSPASFVREFRVEPRMMGIAVPAGTTNGLGGSEGGSGSGAGAVVGAVPAAPGIGACWFAALASGAAVC